MPAISVNPSHTYAMWHYCRDGRSNRIVPPCKDSKTHGQARKEGHYVAFLYGDEAKRIADQNIRHILGTNICHICRPYILPPYGI